jgi:hypothetical protein
LLAGTAVLAQEARNYGPLTGTVRNVQSQYKEFVHDYVRKEKSGAVHVNAPNLKVDVSGQQGKRRVRVQTPLLTADKATSASKQLPLGISMTPRAQADTRTFLQAPMVKIRQFIDEPTNRSPSFAGVVVDPQMLRQATHPSAYAPNPEGSVP